MSNIYLLLYEDFNIDIIDELKEIFHYLNFIEIKNLDNLDIINNKNLIISNKKLDVQNCVIIKENNLDEIKNLINNNYNISLIKYNYIEKFIDEKLYLKINDIEYNKFMLQYNINISYISCKNQIFFIFGEQKRGLVSIYTFKNNIFKRYKSFYKDSGYGRYINFNKINEDLYLILCSNNEIFFHKINNNIIKKNADFKARLLKNDAFFLNEYKLFIINNYDFSIKIYNIQSYEISQLTHNIYFKFAKILENKFIYYDKKKDLLIINELNLKNNKFDLKFEKSYCEKSINFLDAIETIEYIYIIISDFNIIKIYIYNKKDKYWEDYYKYIFYSENIITNIHLCNFSGKIFIIYCCDKNYEMICQSLN